jgi:hypothetical protein
VSTNIDIALVQIKILETMIQCEDFQKRHPRYPAGTIVNGVNVGGQFMPKDGGEGSAAKKTLSEMPAKLIDKLTNLPPTGFIDIEGIGPAFKEQLKSAHQIVKASSSPFTPSTVEATESILASAIVKEHEIDYGNSFHNFFTKGLPKFLKSVVDESALDPVGTLLGIGAIVASALIASSVISSVSTVVAASGVPLLLALPIMGLTRGSSFILFARTVMGVINGPLIDLANEFVANRSYKRIADREESESVLFKIQTTIEKDAARLAKEEVKNLSPNFKGVTSISPDDVRSTLERLYQNGYDRSDDLFAQRIRELNDFAQDGSLALGERWGQAKFKWLKGLINAEIQHGAAIDSLIAAPTTGVEKIDKVTYQKFINSIKKPKTTPVIKGNFLQEDLAKVFEEDLGGLKFWDEKSLKEESRNGNRLAKKNMALIKESLDISKEIDEICAPGQEWRVAYTTSNIEEKTLGVLGSWDVTEGYRAFQSKIQDELRDLYEVDSFITLGHSTAITEFLVRTTGMGQRYSDRRSTAFHETGHAIEIKENLGPQSASYIWDRMSGDNHQGEDTESLSVQSVSPGFFVGEYTGTVIPSPKNNSYVTELVSMGLEQLAHPITAKALAMHDREHLLYTLYALEAHD